VTIGICIEVPIQQIFVRPEVIKPPYSIAYARGSRWGSCSWVAPVA
jgi:hypothetical protein